VQKGQRKSKRTEIRGISHENWKIQSKSQKFAKTQESGASGKKSVYRQKRESS
jgi:hypothetical protein